MLKLGIYLSEMLISYIFFQKTAAGKISYRKIFILGAVMFTISGTINSLFEDMIWLNISNFFLINLIFSLKCFEIKKGKAVFYSAILVILSAALKFATVYTLSSTFGQQIIYNGNSDTLNFIELIMSKALYFFACLILAKIAKKDSANTKPPIGFFIFSFSVVLALSVFWYICLVEYISETNQLLLSVVSLLLFGSTVFLFIIYQNDAEKDRQYFLLKSKLTKLQTEKTYYDILEQQNRDLMLYAHDTKKHLTAINDLNTNPQIEAYLREMTNRLSNYSRSCNSGNKTLDVIVNRYKTECEIKKLNFDFDVRTNNLYFVHDFDLVAILNNLLDNAIEAACNSTERSVFLETDFRNSYSVIVITNSCDRAPVSNDRQLITTKKDKSVHGFGLKSVSDTLKKYNGDLHWDYLKDKNMFVCTVALMPTEQ